MASAKMLVAGRCALLSLIDHASIIQPATTATKKKTITPMALPTALKKGGFIGIGAVASLVHAAVRHRSEQLCDIARWRENTPTMFALYCFT